MFNLRAAFLSKHVIYFIVWCCHVYLVFHKLPLLFVFTLIMDILLFGRLLVQLPPVNEL